jgi:UDP-N-acetylmuramoyl-L-alanyl-D-glutamate--2,6-diaminopimelate ligase
VVNVDDSCGRKIAAWWGHKKSPPVSRLIKYGTHPGADFRMTSLETSAAGSRVSIDSGDGSFTLATSLVGQPNGYNVIAAAAAARAMGIGWDAIGAGVEAVGVVPGRLEPVKVTGKKQPFRVYVDYAHTDDALRGLLETVRQVTDGRVIVVFGCGGDRDRTKRPLMGEHADRLADLVWVTSDNPRSEDPSAIIDQILAGMKKETVQAGQRVVVEADRREAIGKAVSAARKGDAVIIAGKGHETYQIIGDSITHFDDRAVAREALERVL